MVFTGRNPERGARVTAGFRAPGAELAFVRADVSDVTGTGSTVQRTVERHGRIDCLVNAAGQTSRGTLLDTTPELFDSISRSICAAPFFLMQAAVDDMKGAGSAGHHRQHHLDRLARRPGVPQPPTWRRRRAWRA